MPSVVRFRAASAVLRPTLIALAAASAALPAGLHAEDSAPVAPPAPIPGFVRHLDARTRLGFERLKLPGGEGLGLAGVSELLRVQDNVWAGPAVYGAATGQRGGLFVPGMEAAWTPLLGPSLALDLGLFAGGGGGANAPVGGGLMLRPHVDLVWRGPGFYTGPTWSWVRFANGQIDSRQFGWMFSMRSDFDFRGADDAPSSNTPMHGAARGLGWESAVATFARVSPRSGTLSTAGTPLSNAIGLVGIRMESRAGPGPWWGIESAGAASGGVAGYAEVLGTSGMRLAVLDGRALLGARAALGLAGGGGIATGGGVLAKLAAGGTLRLTDTLGLSGEVGEVFAPQGHYRGRSLGLGLDWVLDLPAAAAWSMSGPSPEVPRMEWVSGAERYDAARKVGPSAPLEAVMLGVNRFVGPHLYLSGQAHSAFGGGAGAYSVGLFGVGVQGAVAPAVRVGAEALAGAAGGGGVDTQGGAIVQARAYADLSLDRALSLRVGLGRVKSLQGGLSSPSLDASLVFRFGVDAPAARRAPTAAAAR